MNLGRLIKGLFGADSERSDARRLLDFHTFRQLMNEAQMGQYVDQIIAMAQNSIRVDASLVNEESLSVGCSKLFGQPDLPPGVDWPWSDPSDSRYDDIRARYSAKLRKLDIDDEPYAAGVRLTFLAQFRLSDIAELDTHNMLPHSGMLYFFFDADERRIPVEDPTSWRVIYYDGDLTQLKRTPFPDDLDEDYRFPALSVRMWNELVLPDYGYVSTCLDSVGMSGDEEFTYAEILEKMSPFGNEDPEIHRLLGHPDLLQGDVFLETIDDQDGVSYDDPRALDMAREWTLLFQMDSIRCEAGKCGPVWGDVGRLYFCIRRDDLAAHCFDNVWLVEQCC